MSAIQARIAVEIKVSNLNFLSRFGCVLLAGSIGNMSAAVADEDALTTARVMESLQESDWRQPDPDNLLYMQLESGLVVIELAPRFAPKTAANIKTLVNDGYFDGLAVIRSHDNYVAQWGDPAEEESLARSIGDAAATIDPEYELALSDVDLKTVNSRDAYADTVGFVDGFPAASNGDRVWLTHCYGMLGVARGMAPESGNGASLYVVTGHAPRHLDRNLTVAGRVLAGVENLSSLPRGKGPLGFYESIEKVAPILNIRVASQVAADERLDIKVMRTDTAAFERYVESRTTRLESFFIEPTGRIEVCNITPPVQVEEPSP